MRKRGPWEAAAEDALRYGRFVGSVIEQHERLGRTMDHARTLIAKQEASGRSVSSGTIIIADTVTNSRGRFSRDWHAPPGGLWGTVILVNTLLPPSFRLLPFTVGIACCEALRRIGLQADIRWVNDVLIGGRKVAGFLCESFISDRFHEEYCLLGFGINVNNTLFPEELRDYATSVSLEQGATADLDAFARTFFAALSFHVGLLVWYESRLLAEAVDESQLHPLLHSFLQLTDTVGRPVVYGFDVLAKPQYRAVVVGLTGDGGLRMVLEDGREIVEHSGEIRYLDTLG